MIMRRSTRCPLLLLPALACTLLGVSALAALSAPAAKQSGERAEVRLTKIVERRQLELEPASDAEDGMMPQPNQEPGLDLTFAIDLPEGLTLIDAQQPESLRARDASGADLTDIEPNFMGEVEHVELPMTFDDEPVREFVLHLLPAARTAGTISVEGEVGLVVFESVHEITLTPGTERVELDDPVFGEARGTLQLKRGGPFGGDQPTVTVEMDEAQQRLNRIVLIDDAGSEREPQSTMSQRDTRTGETEVSYTFGGGFDAALQVRLEVRQGLRRVPARILLEDQQLP